MLTVMNGWSYRILTLAVTTIPAAISTTNLFTYLEELKMLTKNMSTQLKCCHSLWETLKIDGKILT